MHGMEPTTADQSKANEKVVNRLIACINDRRVEIMDELFHDDAVMHWPQSGEVVRGAENRRGIYNAFPQLPTITPRRLLSAGNLVVADVTALTSIVSVRPRGSPSTTIGVLVTSSAPQRADLTQGCLPGSSTRKR